MTYSDTLRSSHLTGLYAPKSFITHAASLRQAFAHCARFLTAASRRSLDRVSVPVWPDTLSGRLPIVALVSRYLTNKLMGREPIPKRKLPRRGLLSSEAQQLRTAFGISARFRALSRTRG